jgi:hypothetical protein
MLVTRIAFRSWTRAAVLGMMSGSCHGS